MSGEVRRNCRWAGDRLPAYVDGELTAREAALVAALTATFAADEIDPTATPGESGPPAAFAAQVVAEIRRREGLVRASRGRKRLDGGEPSPLWTAWARPLAAASMVATFLLGSYTALTLDARSYARIVAYEQRAAGELRDNLWSVARRTGLDGLLARYLDRLNSPDR